jgi:hypothetical protein
MTDAQLKVLRELEQDPECKGQAQLKHFIWLNTVAPKYKVGDSFLVTSAGQRIFGVPVRNFRATVTKTYSFKNEQKWYYSLTAHVESGDRKTDSTICVPEDMIGSKVDDNINIVQGKTDAPVDCMSI